MRRAPYDATAWLQIVPEYPKSPAEGSAKVVGCTMSRPSVIADGARLVKVHLTIPASVLDPVEVEVEVVVPEADSPTATAVVP